MSGLELTEERLYLEYGKDANGFPTAKRLIVNRDGKKFLEAEILETRRFEKHADDLFKLP